MNFSLYDIISHLVPGYLLLFSLSQVTNFDINKLSASPSIAFAFAVGYFIQSISSVFEPVLYFTWGGKPSTQILKGKSMLKIKFYHKEKIIQSLKEMSDSQNPTEDELFQIAYRRVNAEKKEIKERVDIFNASYAFARSMVVTLFCIIAMLAYFKASIWYNIFAVIVTIIIWYRAKQRGFYFAKEVLSLYLQLENKSS